MTETLTREVAAERFEELPLPSTADEHWRFTDLRGFEPPEGVSDTSKVSDTGPMLDLDVAGRAVMSEAGIEIVSAPAGITFEPLPADYGARLVPEDEPSSCTAVMPLYKFMARILAPSG